MSAEYELKNVKFLITSGINLYQQKFKLPARIQSMTEEDFEINDGTYPYNLKCVLNRDKIDMEIGQVFIFSGTIEISDDPTLSQKTFLSVEKLIPISKLSGQLASAETLAKLRIESCIRKSIPDFFKNQEFYYVNEKVENVVESVYRVYNITDNQLTFALAFGTLGDQFQFIRQFIQHLVYYLKLNCYADFKYLNNTVKLATPEINVIEFEKASDNDSNFQLIYNYPTCDLPDVAMSNDKYLRYELKYNSDNSIGSGYMKNNETCIPQIINTINIDSILQIFL